MVYNYKLNMPVYVYDMCMYRLMYIVLNISDSTVYCTIFNATSASDVGGDTKRTGQRRQLENRSYCWEQFRWLWPTGFLQRPVSLSTDVKAQTGLAFAHNN